MPATLAQLTRSPRWSAYDRASTRSFDRDGRLHISTANLTKEDVNPYYGREIPSFEELKLDPNKIYMLYRPAEEIEKAVATFDLLPLLSRHVPISAAAHRFDLTVGTTGSDATFEAPYLRNSLTIWAQDAIDDVESGEKRELSCAYRFRAAMKPGQFADKRFDGIMRDLEANHVALVREGRVGSSCIVGDSSIGEDLFIARFPSAARIKLSAFG